MTMSSSRRDLGSCVWKHGLLGALWNPANVPPLFQSRRKPFPRLGRTRKAIGPQGGVQTQGPRLLLAPTVPLALIPLCRDLSRFPTGLKLDGVLCSAETLPASQVAGRVSVTRTMRPSHCAVGNRHVPGENPGARLIPRRHRYLPAGEMGQTGGPCRPWEPEPDTVTAAPSP